MALPSSGQLGINQIRNELGTSNGSLRYLSSLAGKSTPDAISEFWGYSNTVNLYFDWTVPSSATCYQNYQFGAYEISLTGVNTNVNITINWYGDLGGYMTGVINFGTGEACSNNYYVYSGGNINCWGENYSYANVSISPGSNGNQVFNVGNQISYYYC